MRVGSLSMAAAAIAAMGNAITGARDAFDDFSEAVSPRRGRSSYNPNARWRQSAASKEFHIKRAEAKRARKAKELHRLAALGAIEYSPRQMMRNVMMQNGYSQKEADAAFEQMITKPLTGEELQPVSEPRTWNESMTVAELLEYGRSLGLKVTTKMTKAQLIAVLSAT